MELRVVSNFKNNVTLHYYGKFAWYCIHRAISVRVSSEYFR